MFRKPTRVLERVIICYVGRFKVVVVWFSLDASTLEIESF